jgi:adenylate cyclase
MTGTNNEELVKRIARLVWQNQELEEQVKKLVKSNEKLTRELEKLKSDRSVQDRKKDPREPAEKSRKFNMTTVLFADIHGFSKLIESMDSSVMMDELDEILFEFDAIVARYKIEKIKTIGDSFMCAGGIPVKNITNPIDVVMAAMEMRNYLEKFEGEKRGSNRIWDLRIGIHTGPVMAVVTGRKKINYDIKGDTVNTASRIEAICERGNIVMSVMTYELVKEFFNCEYFGKLPVKYKGNLQLYNLRGLKPEFSIEGKGVVPNEAFRIKFGLIQFTDIQEIILDKLERELPGHLYYHNVKHTVDVVTEAELIGWGENCTDEEILILKTAGLFHDAGHTVAYDDHEYHGTVLAREMLPAYSYTPGQIDRICSIIMATKLPPKPKDLLESILCDSDLDYLGRSDFIPVSNTLYEELKAQNKMGSLNDWNKLQVKFISGHQYFTSTARSLREINKQLQIERIQSLIT